MKEEFYQQIREFGILINDFPKKETWLLHACFITIYFKDTEHQTIELISLL